MPVEGVSTCGPRWQVVVLNWNGREDTLRCLESLTRIQGPDVGVVCVDNGSNDGSEEAVRSQFPGVTVIQAGANLGYAGGNNLGIRYALAHGAQWVALVNNDAVVAPDVIEGFGAVIDRHPEAGVLAGKVYFAEPPDRIWFAGQRVNTAFGYSGRPRGYRRRDRERYARIGETDRAVGALMAISRDAIEDVGLLDEDLFAYVEDVDWALRVRKSDRSVLFAPAARAWHRVSASTGGEARSTHTLYYGARNSIIVFERHRPLPPPARWLRRWCIAVTFSMHALRRPDRRRALRAVRSGLADAREGRLGPRQSH